MRWFILNLHAISTELTHQPQSVRAQQLLRWRELGDTVRPSAACWVLFGAVTVVPPLTAQATGGTPLNEAALYSLYAKRHAMTVAFASLGTERATDGDVRKAAEKLVRAHREAREKLERLATERHLTLALPEHDTSTVLLDQAQIALEGKVGRSFDSTWVNLAQGWLSTLILDNNVAVKSRIEPELQPVARGHNTWLFHQSANIYGLRKKFK
jgi:predicted outer membrane protein